MRLIRCDRCKHQFPVTARHTVLRAFDVRRDVIELDVLPAQGNQVELCTECRAAFDRFMAAVPQTASSNSVRQVAVYE